MKIYCLKCKTKTDTYNEEKIKNRVKGKCKICNTNKSSFVSKKVTGEGWTDYLPFEAHLPGHNFTGPGTNLRKRLDYDDRPYAWSKPINQIDDTALVHDLCYRDEKLTRAECDKNMIRSLVKIKPKGLREKFDKAITLKLMGFKHGVNLNT